MEKLSYDVIGAVRCEQPPLEMILTRTQCKYYRAYFKDGKTMMQIAADNAVDVSTVCKTIKAARHRLLQYYQKEV